jgi:AraC-like DNA-binding protein
MSETQNAQTATEMPSTEEIGAMVAAGVGQLLVGIPFTIGARKIIRRVTQHIKPEDLSMKDKILWNVGELGLATVIGQTVGKSVQSATNELFDAAPVPGGRPVLKEELPFGAMQQFIIHLENLLILLARRCRRTKRPVARVRRERRQNALVEDARAYFAENLAHELKIDDICTALGCTRPQLQQAFRARLHRTAMEEFSAMRIEYAAQLLARGASPGEVAAQMGYCSGAYFSQKFRAATGHTPSAYRRIQQGLPARRQNRQQKGKPESKTPIAESPQKE